MRGAILDAAMRPVVIVLLDPTSDAGPCFFQAAILRGPDFLFLQAAMEAFDVAVAFGVMIGRPPMSDAERARVSRKREEVNCVPFRLRVKADAFGGSNRYRNGQLDWATKFGTCLAPTNTSKPRMQRPSMDILRRESRGSEPRQLKSRRSSLSGEPPRRIGLP